MGGRGGGRKGGSSKFAGEVQPLVVYSCEHNCRSLVVTQDDRGPSLAGRTGDEG